MLYATATILYGALSVTLGRTSRRMLAFFLSGVVVPFSITYCFTGDIKAFLIYFLVMVLMVSFQCGWLLLTSNFERKSNEEMTNLAGYGTGEIRLFRCCTEINDLW
jgi:dihydroceramidase